MLPDLDTETSGDIAADNLRAVQAVYLAWQMEEMRVFQVVDRIAELFQQGLLPIGAGQAGAKLQRYLCANKDRLTAPERQQLYARVLGVPGGQADGLEPNREFQSLWLQFVGAVSSFARQHEVDALLRPHSPANAQVRRAALALVANTSVYGAHYFAAKELAANIKQMLALLDDPEIKQAYGARDMWQVIDQVNRNELSGAANLAGHRTQAQMGGVVLQWLAAHTEALRKPAVPVGKASPSDADLINAVEQWLAVSGLHDAAVQATAQPVHEAVHFPRPGL
jgi:hypothetical protein